MQMIWNFASTTPAGERAPGFPAGIQRGFIHKVEDEKPKNDGEAPAAFYVYIKNHPTEGRPEAKGCEARIRFGYGEKSFPFVMHLIMATRNLKTEDLQKAGNIQIDPTDQRDKQGFVGFSVWFDSRPASRVDQTDPTKKYDDHLILTAEEAAKLAKERAEAAQAAAAGQAAASAANASLLQQAPAQQQVVQQQVQAGGFPAAGGLPGMGGGAAPVGGGLPGMPSIG